MISSRASEFQEMTPHTTGRLKHQSAAGGAGGGGGGVTSGPTTPRIIVKAVCLVGVCLERDAGVTKMGGEPTRTLAFEKMHRKATAFFSSLLGDKGRHLLTGPNLWHSDRIGNLHTALYDFASGSRLQV